ncbi:unnamed protein product [Urochloa humidicola]
MAGRDPTRPASAHRGSGGGPVRAGLSPQLRAAAHGLVTQIGSSTSSWATGDERRHLTWLLDSSVRQQRAPPLPHHRQELWILIGYLQKIGRKIGCQPRRIQVPNQG